MVVAEQAAKADTADVSDTAAAAAYKYRSRCWTRYSPVPLGVVGSEPRARPGPQPAARARAGRVGYSVLAKVR
jgi:hypothetical protein